MGRNNKSKKTELPLKSKLKKDPGIPRLPEVRVRAKYRTPKVNIGGSTDPDTPMASEPTLSSLALLAANSVNREEMDDPSSSTGTQKTKEQLRKHYVRTLHKVIDESDIVILVLDARDPEGCRSRLVEEEVRRRESEGKKLIFVLNKIDLIPRGNAQEWLRYLRHSTPTLPFKSATMHQRTHLSTATAPALVRLLKAYKPGASQSVTVGVVGYPNVGKSSLINSLKRSKVCAVAAQPGHTKELQTIQLERGIKIVDSPGVVFDDDDFDVNGKGGKKESILLRNAIKVEDVDDPIAVVEQILARTDHEMLKKIYNLPHIASTLEFLTMMALTNGRLLKGGTPDVLGASRQVLMDWNHQKIPYMSIPPTIHASSIPSTIQSNGERVIAPGAENVGQAQILTEMAKPFTLEGLFGAADAGAFGAPDAEMEEEVMEEDTMEQDEIPMESEEMIAPAVLRKRSLSPATTISEPLSYNMSARQRKLMEMDSGILRGSKRRKTLELEDVHSFNTAPVNPFNRKVLKQEAKRARRAANKLTGKPSSGMEIDDDNALAFQFTFAA